MILHDLPSKLLYTS